MSLVNITGVSNFNAGNTCSIELPTGSTYNHILMDVTGATKAQVTNIKVKINGKTFQEFDDLTALDEYNDYWKRPYSGDYSILFFERPELIEDHRRVCAIGTLDIQNFTIEMDVDAAAVTPAIRVKADTDVNTPLGMVTKIKQFPVSFTVSGQNDIDKIPRTGKIAAIHMYKADVNAVVLERDSVNLIDASKADLEQEQKIFSRVPVTAKATHLDFIKRGLMTEALEVQRYADGRPVQDLRARVDLGTSGQIQMRVEYFDSFSGL